MNREVEGSGFDFSIHVPEEFIRRTVTVYPEGPYLPLKIYQRNRIFGHIRSIEEHEGKPCYKSYLKCSCSRAEAIRYLDWGHSMDDVRLSGIDVEMTEDDYRKLFNEEAVSIKEMNNEQLQQRIHELELYAEQAKKAERYAKIRAQACIINLDQRISVATAEEREAIRKRDALYKPLKKPIELKDPKNPKTPGKSPIEKAIISMMACGMSREAAEAHITKLQPKSIPQVPQETPQNPDLDPDDPTFE